MSGTARSPKAIVLCLTAIALLTAMDLGTKHWALDRLSQPSTQGADPVCEPDTYGRILPQREQRPPIVWIEGYLELRYAENCGAAFGFMRDMPSLVRKGVFYVAAGGAIVLLLWMFVSGRGGKLFAVSVPLIVAGAIGNFVDRVKLGYVVDFVRFHLQDRWAYPTFNVADAWITIGVILILIEGFIYGRREKQAKIADLKPR
ncbi:MAG: signal peptidase II [Deltaproteobacteria bacterium]|nr:signal peptidase II [Deltaproteobacteria bacterium]